MPVPNNDISIFTNKNENGIKLSGRISSADFASEDIRAFLVVSSIIKASLYPVKIPWLIDEFQSDNLTPFRSIFSFIEASIEFSITQLSELL